TDNRFDPAVEKIAPDPLRRQPQQLADQLVLRLFGPGDFSDLRDRARATLTTLSPTLTDNDIRTVLHHLMSTPEFQLT
ncbi:MAG: hypothetical protein WA771_07840, partial [Chthoniobacterales bacterium]